MVIESLIGPKKWYEVYGFLPENDVFWDAAFWRILLGEVAAYSVFPQIQKLMIPTTYLKVT